MKQIDIGLLIEDYQNGKTIKELSITHNVNNETIRRKLKNNGVNTSKKVNNPECIHCEGKTQKHGKNESGNQRYKCIECGKFFGEKVNEVKKKREERYAMIRKMYIDEGLSTTEIGNRLGVSSTVPQRILKSMGLTRSISESKLGKKLGSKFNIDDIIKLYRSGLSSVEVSQEIGCSKRTVITLLHENNVALDNIYEYHHPKTNEILSLYKKGLSMNKVGKELNVSYGVINSITHKFGVARTDDKFRLGVPHDEYLSQINEWEKYKRLVIKITNKQPISYLNGYKKRGIAGGNGVTQLDHKFSIFEGFKQDVSPELIGNIVNLEFIPWKDNISKGSKCSITLVELTSRVKT